MRIERDTGHFIALAGLIVALFVWSDSRLNGRMDRVEAGLRAEVAELRGEIDELRTEVATLRARVGDISERLARLEGVMAAALGRPFPGDGRLTRAPDTEAGE